MQAREPERLWGDVQFVAEATVGLAACRLVLKWTYVLAHSLVDESAEKNLFCFLQVRPACPLEERPGPRRGGRVRSRRRRFIDSSSRGLGCVIFPCDDSITLKVDAPVSLRQRNPSLGCSHTFRLPVRSVRRRFIVSWVRIHHLSM